MWPDMRRVVHIVALVLSAISAAILLFAAFAPPQTIYRVSTMLMMPHPNGETCILCGMTRAFVALSKGDLASAVQFNAWCVWLALALIAFASWGAYQIAGWFVRILSER